MFDFNINGYTVQEIVKASGIKAREVRDIFNTIEPDVKSDTSNKLYSAKIINHLLYFTKVDNNTMLNIFNIDDFMECLSLSGKFTNITKEDAQGLLNQLANQYIVNPTADIKVAFQNLNDIQTQGYQEEEEEYIRAVNILNKSLAVTLKSYEKTIKTREAQKANEELLMLKKTKLHKDLIALLSDPLEKARKLIEKEKGTPIDGLIVNVDLLQKNLGLI